MAVKKRTQGEAPSSVSWLGPWVDGLAVKLLLMLPSRRRWWIGWVMLLCWPKSLTRYWQDKRTVTCWDQTGLVRVILDHYPLLVRGAMRSAQVLSVNHSAVPTRHRPSKLKPGGRTAE